MSLSSIAKPTKGNVRRRVRVMYETAESGARLARRWNPKGRYFQVQRDLINLFDEVERVAGEALEVLDR
jgi:hypothetical protein